MIPRITRGSSAHSALSYDFGPGRREEHENPRTVAGNVPGDWREQAATIDETVAAKPRVEKGIHRTSLRTAPEDRTLSDEEWGQVAERYVKDMGVKNHPWTATRHGDDHIHLTVSRVSWEGKVTPLSHDYVKAQAVCRGIEHEHDLADASRRYDRSRPQVSHGEKERAERLGQPSEREQLRGHIDASAAAAAREGQAGEVDPRATRDRFEEALTQRGVSFRRNEASTGRVSGYSYGLDAHRDARGEQVFYKGSDLGKEYRWGAVQERMNERVEPEQTRTSSGGSGGANRSGEALARLREQEGAKDTQQMPRSRREPSAGSSERRGQGMPKQSERQQKGSERAQESLGRMRDQEAARGGQERGQAPQGREKAPRERSQAAQDRDDLKYEQQQGYERLQAAAKAEGKDLFDGPSGRGGGSPEENLAVHHEMHLHAVEHHRHIQEDEKRRQQRLEQSRGHER